MIPKQIIARSMMFACVLLSACGHSGEENPQPGKPEPEKPVEEENYLTVTTRNGAPVESYEQSFAAFAQTLVVRSNVKWEVSAGNAAAWLHVEATSAATAEVAIEVNTGREVRSGTIVFTTTDPKVRVEIPVRQNFGETIGRAPIRDLMLIYDGYDDGRAFDDKRFAKYAASDDDAPQWLFDGYLFLTAHRGGKSFSGGLNRPASNKQDWEAIVDFYLEDTHSIPALDRAVGALRDQIGGTFHRRKVVIFMPEPQEGQTDWGEIDGKAMDFSNYPDRIAACKWYIDRVRERFARGNYEHIELAGFYWLREIVTRPVDTQYSYHLTRSDIMLPHIADYLHKLDYTFNWIPYYGSRGYDVWQQFGFDQVYLQPNYYWKPQNDMDEVCRQIDSLGIGMEIEFEPTLLNAREGSGTFRKRLRDYIDYAKRRNIYGKRPFAYYHGTNGFYDLHASDDEADRELFDELCQFIINNPLRAQRPTTDRK